MSKSYRNKPYKLKEKTVKVNKESKVVFKNKVLRSIIDEEDFV